LNRDLVDQARQTLARLPMADRAYTLLKSTIYTPPIRDWIALEHGGPGMATVFETANNAPLETVRVPGFFTYEGFYRALLDPMPSIAQKLQKEKWVLGSLAEQGPVSDQYSNLPDAILERYRNEFIAAWNVALGNLQLRPLLSDKPKYLALSAASSPASPLVYLFESIRNETALTRERKKPQPNESMSQGENEALYAVRNRLGSTERIALDLALKNQRKASDPPPSIPGAAIEDNFREYYKLVDGEPRGRLIDALLENLNQLYTDLNVAATNPTQSKQALEQAEQQVGYLSANVSRLPQPLRGWIDKVAKDAAGDTARDATARTIADLSDAMAENVTAPCQQIISGRYPFFGKGQDVPLADFGRLFAQGGIIERFFSTSLAPLVNMTGRTWTWRPNSNLTHRLSDVTLRQFQQAAEIRDAFFATGSAPNVNLEVKLNSLDASAQTSTLTVGGGPPIVSQSNSNTGSTLQWPGVGPSGASIALAPELPDQGKSVKEREGPWALFRLIDDGSVTPRGSSIVVGFIVGGRDVSYQFNASSLVNPLTMSSLRQFRCPNGL
jgi:type VI secretion system protein ImpL